MFYLIKDNIIQLTNSVFIWAKAKSKQSIHLQKNRRFFDTSNYILW